MRRGLWTLILLCAWLAGHTQTSTNDLPLFLTDTVVMDLYPDSLTPVVVLPPPDSSLMDTIANDSLVVGPLQFGVVIDTEWDFMQFSTAFDIGEEGVIRRLKIHSPEAHALSILFDGYWLPTGTKLHVYSDEEDDVAGGFTETNNHADGKLQIRRVTGPTVIIEYHAPAGTIEQPVLFIDRVVYDYTAEINPATGKGTALECIPDVACSEGDAWRDEERAVVHLDIGGFGCSGVLLNNAYEDQTPYVLTSLHCIDQSVNGARDGILNDLELDDASNVIAYFADRTFICGDDDHTGHRFSISGCSVVAYNKNTDFALLKFNRIPAFTNAPYFAGWDASGGVPAPGMASISHPKDDFKKIALDAQPAVSEPGVGYYKGAIPPIPSHHTWRADFEVGGVETGSSGSALFEDEGYVVGNLIGSADLFCDPGSYPAWYGKISVSWNGSDPTERLRDWLDPGNWGVTKWPGYDPLCNTRTITHITYEDSAEEEAHRTLIGSTGVVVQTPDPNTQNAYTTPVNYTASGNVILRPGFIVRPEGRFRAFVSNTDCASYPIIGISGSDDICRTGGAAFSARVIYGTPPYSYSWSNSINNQTSNGNSYAINVGLSVLRYRMNVELQVTDANGHMERFTKEVRIRYCKNGFEEQPEKSTPDNLRRFDVYPNPSDGEFTILARHTTNANAQIEVYSTLGQHLQTLTMDGTMGRLDLSGFGSGVYILNIHSAEGTHTQRVVIE